MSVSRGPPFLQPHPPLTGTLDLDRLGGTPTIGPTERASFPKVRVVVASPGSSSMDNGVGGKLP